MLQCSESTVCFITGRTVICDPMTGNKMTCFHFAQDRVLAAANALREGAASGETTTVRHVHRARWIALQTDALAAPAGMRVKRGRC